MKKNYNVDDAIDFIFDGNQSDLPGLSSDEKESDEIEGAVETTFLMANQLMLQNLTMKLLLLF